MSGKACSEGNLELWAPSLKKGAREMGQGLGVCTVPEDLILVLRIRIWLLRTICNSNSMPSFFWAHWALLAQTYMEAQHSSIDAAAAVMTITFMLTLVMTLMMALTLTMTMATSCTAWSWTPDWGKVRMKKWRVQRNDLGLGGLHLLWWRASTIQSGNSVHSLGTA